jgi:hypothetical protein
MAPKHKDGDVVVAVGVQCVLVILRILSYQQFSGKWVSWAHTIVAYCENPCGMFCRGTLNDLQ